MKTMRITALALMLGAVLALVPQAGAQTVLSSTTLAAALSATSSAVSLTSATGVTNPGPNQTALKVLVVDHEVMLVTSISGTIAQVTRGQYGTLRVGHLSGADVWIAPDNALARGAIPSGSCTRTALRYVPIVYVAPSTVNGGFTGARYDCLGGQIVRTDAPVSVKGSTVTPAATITPTGTYFATDTGTTTIATITVPAGWAAGNCLAIQPGATGATNTTGNIGLTTSAFVVGRVIFFCWDGSKWYPSYVS